MEREHHHGAGSPDDRERAALQAAIDAEIYSRSMQTFQTVPIYGPPVHGMGPVPYHGAGHVAPQNFAYNAGFGHNIMAGGRFLHPTNPFPNYLVVAPSPPPPPPPVLPPPASQLAQWQMMHRALQELGQTQAIPESGAYGPVTAGQSFFGGRHAPSSSIQTTGPPRHAFIFQRSTMGEDLHSQGESIAQTMTRSEPSRPHGATGLSAFPPNTGFMINQLDYSGLQPHTQHFHQPVFDNEGNPMMGYSGLQPHTQYFHQPVFHNEENPMMGYSGLQPHTQYFHQPVFHNEENPMMGYNPPPTPPRPIFGDPHAAVTFYPPYQGTMTYDNQHHTNAEDFWQEQNRTQATSSRNDEPAGYGMPQVLQPPDSAYNPFPSCSQQHDISPPESGVFAVTREEPTVTELKIELPRSFTSPWPLMGEEIYIPRKPYSYQPKTIDMDDYIELDKNMQELSERLMKLTSFDDDTVEESDDTAAEHTIPYTEKNRQWFRSTARGRRRTLARRARNTARAKRIRYFRMRTVSKETKQTAHGKKGPKETWTKETAQVDAAKETSTKEIACTGSTVEETDITETEEAAQDTEQTSNRARTTRQKKQKRNLDKKYD